VNLEELNNEPVKAEESAALLEAGLPLSGSVRAGPASVRASLIK